MCAVLIGVLAWPSQMDAPLPAPPPPRVRQITTAKDDSGDDGRARTVEHGFTALEDAAREHLVSWGVILENTSHRMTARLMVTVTILDRAGKPVLTEQLDADIEPGKRFGLGDTAYVKRPGARTMKIELSRPEWWPTTSAVPPLAPVTASQVKGRLPQVRRRSVLPGLRPEGPSRRGPPGTPPGPRPHLPRRLRPPHHPRQPVGHRDPPRQVRPHPRRHQAHRQRPPGQVPARLVLPEDPRQRRPRRHRSGTDRGLPPVRPLAAYRDASGRDRPLDSFRAPDGLRRRPHPRSRRSTGPRTPNRTRRGSLAQLAELRTFNP